MKEYPKLMSNLSPEERIMEYMYSNVKILDYPAIKQAQRLVRADILRENLGDMFSRTNYSKGYLKNIYSALEGEGIVFPGDLSKRFADPQTMLKWGSRKSLFYETKAKLFGGWYTDPVSGLGKFSEGSAFKLPQGDVLYRGAESQYAKGYTGPAVMGVEGAVLGESSVEFQRRTIKKLKDLGAAFYAPQTGPLYESIDPAKAAIGTAEAKQTGAFLERALEKQDFEQLYLSMRKGRVTPKNMDQVFASRKESYLRFLNEIDPIQSRSIELDVLSKSKAQQGAIFFRSYGR